MSDYQSNTLGNVWAGLGWVTLGHLITCGLAAIFANPFLFFGIGIVQLIYVLPMTYIFRDKSQTVMGIWIAFGLTFLLNSACFGIFMFGAIR